MIWLMDWLQQLAAALTFYTCLPLPATWTLDFTRVARWVPLVGVVIGGILSGLDFGLRQMGMPMLTASALVVAVWLMLTGGFHLDGAMDTADGLAVTDPARRLEVMADSVTGAFGAMTAVIVLLLKTAALSDIGSWRWLILVLAAGWGRWGQQVAIVRYVYLKPTGKGAFHKAALQSGWDILPMLLLLLGLSAAPVLFNRQLYGFSLGLGLLGMAIASATAAWYNRKLGGHTGDTYGAVVEWTEALFLVAMTLIH